MKYQEGLLTQPEELVLDIIRKNMIKDDLSYAFLYWKDEANTPHVTIVVAGPHDKNLFEHIDGLHYTNPEEFALDICMNHCCVGPEFLMEAASICGGSENVGSEQLFLKAPGMNCFSSNGRFYAICSEEAVLVDGVSPDTINCIKEQRH